MSPVAVSSGAGVTPLVSASGGTWNVTPAAASAMGSGIGPPSLLLLQAPLGTVIAFGPPFGLGSQPEGLGPYGSHAINF